MLAPEKRMGLCGHPLSIYNPNDLCGPCTTRFLREHRNEELPKRMGKPRAALVNKVDRRRKSMCLNGHVIAEVGRGRSGECLECGRLRDKAYREKKKAERQGKPGRWDSYVILENLAALIADKRKNGIPQRIVARQAGISEHRLKHYVSKRNRCSPEIAEKIARSLGVTLDELREG